MDWQAASSPPRFIKRSTQPKRKALLSKEPSDDSASSLEPGEVKRKDAKKAKIQLPDSDLPSTSAAARAAEKIRNILKNNPYADLSSDGEDDNDDDSDDSSESSEEDSPQTAQRKRPAIKMVKTTEEGKEKCPATKPAKTIKPPPIFIPDVTNISLLIATITETVGANKEFSYKASRDNKVRVMLPDKESYTALKNSLDSAGKKFYTFQPRDERAYRIVIKGLHYSTSIDFIKEELRAQGHSVRDAHNAIGHRTKSPLPLFFINLEPAANNKEAYNIKRLCKSVVTVEPPLKFDDIPQCYRCQGYGHSQRYCKLQVCCVKCGENHSSIECQKKNDDLANCVNCGGSHPASYRGCPAYKKAKAALSPKQPRLTQLKDARNSHPTPYPSTQPIDMRNRSFADAIKGGRPSQPPNQQPPVETKESEMTAIMARMESMFEKMLDKMFKQMTVMITSILSKVCK